MVPSSQVILRRKVYSCANSSVAKLLGVSCWPKQSVRMNRASLLINKGRNDNFRSRVDPSLRSERPLIRWVIFSYGHNQGHFKPLPVTGHRSTFSWDDWLSHWNTHCTLPTFRCGWVWIPFGISTDGLNHPVAASRPQKPRPARKIRSLDLWWWMSKMLLCPSASRLAQLARDTDASARCWFPNSCSSLTTFNYPL